LKSTHFARSALDAPEAAGVAEIVSHMALIHMQFFLQQESFRRIHLAIYIAMTMGLISSSLHMKKS
jgi:hypothetical protein